MSESKVRLQAPPGRPSMTLRRAVWTAALVGGLLSGFLIKAPGARLHPYWMVVLGASVAVYTLRLLQQQRGQRFRIGQGTHVATLSGFIPGIVAWATLRPDYHLVIKAAEDGVRAAAGNPHIPPEQAQAWLNLVKSPTGPWLIGALTLVAILFVAAFTGAVWDIGGMLSSRRD